MDSDTPMDEPNPLDSVARAALAAQTNRRVFLRRASALTLAIPGLGAALTACRPEHAARDEHAAALGRAPQTIAPQDSVRVHNPDSELDTSLHQGSQLSSTVAPASTLVAPFARFDPALPPLSTRRTIDVHFHARQVPLHISDDTVVAGWTFDGNIPGPIVHCRVGDTVRFTLTNEMDVPHSMDFHAARINPKVAFRSAAKGESVSYVFTPRYAGAFLYHCGTSPVLMHLGSGMYGAIVVSPREPLPRAREFVLVHSEFYLGAAAKGVRPFDYGRMLSDLPDVVTFNGRPNQYSQDPIRVNTGERVRFWVVNAGPTLTCAFHVVGQQFDTVYIGAPPSSAIHGVQTFSVAAGGGMAFELTADIPGEFPFVNHEFGHGQKGATGFMVVG
ncbi:MAG TPA: multicopper oxidase domain-containing protein [Gemmatimonadaceae bacterium]|nr:multicopper oxidase domain-containing protein [Gemmatimonadaceae bacterium]